MELVDKTLALLKDCKDRILAVLQAWTILAMACWQRLAGEKVKGVSRQNPGPIGSLQGADPVSPAGTDNPSPGMLAEAGWRES